MAVMSLIMMMECGYEEGDTFNCVPWISPEQLFPSFPAPQYSLLDELTCRATIDLEETGVSVSPINLLKRFLFSYNGGGEETVAQREESSLQFIVPLSLHPPPPKLPSVSIECCEQVYFPLYLWHFHSVFLSLWLAYRNPMTILFQRLGLTKCFPSFLPHLG